LWRNESILFILNFEFYYFELSEEFRIMSYGTVLLSAAKELSIKNGELKIEN